MKIKLDSDALLNMKLFTKTTRVDCVDCFSVDNVLVFVTKKGKAGKAIGAGGKNIKKLNRNLNKKIKVIEDSDNCCSLIENYLFPIKPRKCKEKKKNGKKIIELELKSSRERRALLNRQQKGLKELKSVVSRYYPKISDIKILSNLR